VLLTLKRVAEESDSAAFFASFDGTEGGGNSADLLY
jgi:hypothetical protein